MLQEIESVEDMRMMFDHTVITYKGDPVYIEGIIKKEEGYFAECYFLGTSQRSWILLNEKDFNFTPVRTGYVNIRGFAVFFHRLSVRRFKQGLSRENMQIVNMLEFDWGEAGDYHAHRYNHVLEEVKSLRSRELYNTFKGYYPSIQDAIEQFEDNAIMVAFDRQFAIDRDMNVYFKSRIVGKYSTKTKRINFKQDFKHLSMALRENYAVQ